MRGYRYNMGTGLLAAFTFYFGSAAGISWLLLRNLDALKEASESWPQWVFPVIGFVEVFGLPILAYMIGGAIAERFDASSFGVLGFVISGVLVLAFALVALLLYAVFVAFGIMTAIVAGIALTSD